MSQRRTRRERREAQGFTAPGEAAIRAKAFDDSAIAEMGAHARERFRAEQAANAERLLSLPRRRGEGKAAQNLQHMRIDRVKWTRRAMDLANGVKRRVLGSGGARSVEMIDARRTP